MRSLLAVAFAALTVPLHAADLPPLAEVRRIPFGPSLDEIGAASLFLHPETPIGYAASNHHLFVFDATTGDDLGGLDLGPAVEASSTVYWYLKGIGDRLLAWSYSADGFALIDIDEPSAPELLFTAPGLWSRPWVAATFDEGMFAIRFDYAGFDLYAIDPLRRIVSMPHAMGANSSFGGPYASADGEAFAFLAFMEGASNPQRLSIVAYDVAGGTPVRRFVREVEAGVSVRSMVVDRGGDVLVILQQRYAPSRREWVETIDARTGATLASWDVVAGATIVLSQGGGRFLLQVDPAGIEFVDLSDPAHPQPIGRHDLPPVDESLGRSAVPSGSEPFVFVTDPAEKRVLALDARTATEIARVPVNGGVPLGLALRELTDGTRRGAVVVRRVDWQHVYSRGGRAHLDLLDLTIPTSAEPTGRFLRIHPTRPDEARAIGGRYAVLYESASNSLVLVDLSEGVVKHVTGASGYLWEFANEDDPKLWTTDRFALVAGRFGWERFVLENGRLEPLGARIPGWTSEEGLEAAQLSEVGTVVALGWRLEGEEFSYFLETTGIDGRSARLPREYASLLFLATSPAGDLLAVSRRESYEGYNGVDVYDISDPSAPALLWTLRCGVTDAVFDPTGTRLLISGPQFDFSSFTLATFDARTGTPLGPPSDPVPKFAYHGIGAQWIAEGAWRAIYWKWNWVGWDNALIDLSGPAPALMQTYRQTGSFPEFAPREGGGWYELRRNPWNELANLVIGTSTGNVVQSGWVPGDQEGLSAVRRGFVATIRSESDSFATSLWRDASLNRRPVVVTPGDQEIECTFPEGASARLDASASWDPDSAPGTNDDVASFAWMVDGAGAGSEPVVDVVLALGSHAATVEVRDGLGAPASATFAVAVADRTAPDAIVEFEPLFEGGVFTRSFRVLPAAEDLCDPAPSTEARLRIPEAASTAPVDWEHAAASSVEVRTGAKGTRVVVLGPDEEEARAAWDDALRVGGFAVGPESRLELGATTRGVLWRFLTAGSDLVRGVAYGDSDLVVDSEARDASGNAAAISASLRETACAALPAGSTCPGW